MRYIYIKIKIFEVKIEAPKMINEQEEEDKESNLIKLKISGDIDEQTILSILIIYGEIETFKVIKRKTYLK